MSKSNSGVIIHMVSSLDGMIARKDNSISWFDSSSPYERGADGENPEEFLRSVGCYVMGSRTYELAVELSKSYGWAYGDTPTVVVTSRNLTSERSNIEFYSGDLGMLVDKLVSRYGNVWMVGGAYLTREFIRLGLAHEIRVTILPVLLGEGLPFFDGLSREYPLHLMDCTAYKNGMVELRYGISTSGRTDS